MGKSADAFRTISEVADWLETPAHVLRFWESKFPQIKPVKRAGGRRYYRPADMELIGGIKKLLHDDGMTIKGVQKILRDQGVRHVAALSPPIDGDTSEDTGETIEVPAVTTAEESATVLPFQRTPAPAAPAAQGKTAATPDPDDTRTDDHAESRALGAPDATPPAPEAAQESRGANAEGDTGQTTAPGKSPDAPPPEEKAPPAALPGFLHPDAPNAMPPRTAPRHDPRPESPPARADAVPPKAPESQPESESASPRPARIDLPPDPADDSITADPGLLAAIAARKGKPLAPGPRKELRALRDRLAALHSRQSGGAEAAAPD